jgi:diamine N-acetyltransferase
MISVQKINNKEDLETIQKLAYEIWPICYKNIVTEAQITYMLVERYAIEVLTAEWEQNEADFYLAFNKEMPVGFASISKAANEPCKLHKLYVLTHIHGLGIGKALFNTIKAAAENNMAPNIYLQVNRNNVAVQFYLKQGMQIAEEKDVDIGNGFYMNDYIMTLPLLVK